MVKVTVSSSTGSRVVSQPGQSNNPVRTVEIGQDQSAIVTALNQSNLAIVTAGAAYNVVNASSVVLTQQAFDKANSANLSAKSAYDQANAAFITASADFDLANTDNANISIVYGVANNLNITIGSAYSQANSANIRAISAYAQANIAFEYADLS